MLTTDEVRAIIQAALADAIESSGRPSTQVARTLAREWGVSVQFLNEVVSGHREPGKTIPRALGLERVVMYREKERGDA